jgi:hypothetical protein
MQILDDAISHMYGAKVAEAILRDKGTQRTSSPQSARGEEAHPTPALFVR